MNWNNGMNNGGGSGWWLFMVLMMVLFVVGAIWLIVTLVRHNPSPPHQPGVPTARPGPDDILHERFARGEMDVDEYHQRIDALRAKRPD